MPGEAHGFLGRCLNVLGDVALQGFVIQAKICAFGIEVFFLQVITVVAIEITDRSDRLDHNLKFTGCSFQKHLRKRTMAASELGSAGSEELYSKNRSMSSDASEQSIGIRERRRVNPDVHLRLIFGGCRRLEAPRLVWPPNARVDIPGCQRIV